MCVNIITYNCFVCYVNSVSIVYNVCTYARINLEIQRLFECANRFEPILPALSWALQLMLATDSPPPPPSPSVNTCAHCIVLSKSSKCMYGVST